MSDVSLHPRYRRRHRRRSRRRALVGVIVVLSLLMSVAGLWVLSNVVAKLGPVDDLKLPVPPPIEITERARPPLVPGRPVFRHSVVRGGVYTADEVEAAMDRDPIVASHYSGVNAGALRVETIDDRDVFMSYRIGDEIFWTKQKVRLQKGEAILTDGVHHIRARCGNCIAFAPAGPTAGDEPDEMEFALADDEGVGQPRMLLGGESLLQPLFGKSLPWLLGVYSDDAAVGYSTGAGWIGIPLYGSVADPWMLTSDPSGILSSPGVDGGLSPDGLTASSESLVDWPLGDPRGPRDPDVRGDPTFPSENPVLPVPEPATLLLVGAGLAALATRLRRP